MATPVVIDTDPGVDDAVALWWALTSPALDVVALTTVHGNVDVDLAAANALRIVHAAGRPDVPVAVGEAAAIGPAPVTAFPRWIHGQDGLGDVDLPPAPLAPVAEPAVDLLRRVVDERPGEVAVVTLGPLSNVARVLAADPTWASRVGRLVVMAGSAAVGGNATPAAEANVAHDPDALAAVLAADWPEPPLLIGLDATHEATLGPGELALCTERRTPAAAFCDGPAAVLQRRGRPPERRRGLPRPAGRARPRGPGHRRGRRAAGRRRHRRRAGLGGHDRRSAPLRDAGRRVRPLAGRPPRRRRALPGGGPDAVRR